MRWKMWSHHGPWLLLALLGTVACADAKSESHGVVLDSVATVALAEPDSVPVTQTLAPFHASDGSWYVTDNKGDRILHFASTGAYLGGLGRHGQGPGEFEGLGDVFELGMDTIAATDWSLRRVTFFSHGRRLDSMLTLPSTPMSATVHGHSVWFGGVNPASMTALLQWDRNTGRITSMIPLPADFQEGSPLVGIFTNVEVVPWADSMLVAVGGYPWLRVYTTAGEAADSFLVPIRLVDPTWLARIGPMGLLLVWFGQVVVRGGGTKLHWGVQPRALDLIIDGYTQPGASPNTLAVGNDAVMLVEINGNGSGTLTINSGGSINVDTDYGFDVLGRVGMKMNESTLAYALAGGGTGLAVALFVRSEKGIGTVHIADPGALAAIAGAGMLAGIVYWMAAGRRAGRAAGKRAT